VVVNGNAYSKGGQQYWQQEDMEMLKHQLAACIFGKEDKELKIWVPKCNAGEEAYVIGIVLHELLGKQIDEYQILILATDDDKNAVIRASNGIYSPAALNGMGQERIDQYFVRRNGMYEVSKIVKNKVFFSHQGITQSPPFAKFDFISYRGLITDTNEGKLTQYKEIFKSVINENGVLFEGWPFHANINKEGMDEGNIQYK